MITAPSVKSHMLVVVACLYMCSLPTTAEDCIGASCIDEASLSHMSLLQSRLHVDQENLHDADDLQMLSGEHDLMSNPGKSSSADFYNHMAMFSGESEADPGLSNMPEGRPSLPNYPEVLTAVANTSVHKKATSEYLHPGQAIMEDPQLQAVAREMMANPDKSSAEFYKQMSQLSGGLPLGEFGVLDLDESGNGLMNDPEIMAVMSNSSFREIVQEGDLTKITGNPVLASVVKKVFTKFGGSNGVPQEFVDFITTPRTAAKWEDMMEKGHAEKYKKDPEVQQLVTSVKKKMAENQKKRFEQARKLLESQLKLLPGMQDRQDDSLTVDELAGATYKSQALHDLEASAKKEGSLSGLPVASVEAAHDEAYQLEIESLLQQSESDPMTMDQ